MVNILLVGSGGREAALEWKLKQSSQVDEVFTAPGNAGSSNNLPYGSGDIQELVEFAQKNRAFTVVGPEAPLTAGLVNTMVDNGLEVFGPSKEASYLESSKIYAKNFMKRQNILTPDFEIFDEYDQAEQYIENRRPDLVVKADGLASGKGVFVCSNLAETRSALKSLLVDRRLGTAGEKVIIEETIEGEEASCFFISDGDQVIPFSSAQDHKRIFDGDKGPNTGGMGCFSPALLSADVQEEVNHIANRTISGMKSEGIPYKGFLYLGVMIVNDKPYLLEYNVRLGDPEAQVLLPRCRSDLFPYLKACVEGDLRRMEAIEWSRRNSVCVVMASGGYPQKFETGKTISGLADISEQKDVYIFHAGTLKDDDNIVTNGGRVLGITALRDTINDAINAAYTSVGKISWDGEYHRKDIAHRASNGR